MGQTLTLTLNVPIGLIVAITAGLIVELVLLYLLWVSTWPT